MELRWHQNPLWTAVLLDAREKEALRAALAHQLEREPSSPEEPGLEEQRSRLVEALEEGAHLGDCVCIAAACDRCHAERLLGVDVLQGLSKRAGSQLLCAFQEGRGLREALRWLEAHADPAWPGWMPPAPTEEDEAASALRWLRRYRAEHFPEG